MRPDPESPVPGNVQYPVHAFPVAGRGTEEWVIARRRRGELRHHGYALIAHRRIRDHALIIFRNDALVVLDVLVHGVHLTGIHEHPVMARTQELAAMMERQPHACAARTGQRVGMEREEIAVRLDEEVDNLRLTPLVPATSHER